MSHTCIICKQKILIEKEKWVKLTDYDKKQMVRETFYHLECWRDRFRISNSLRKQKMMKQVMGSMGGIMNSIKTLQKNIPNEPHEEKYETVPF